MIILNEIKKIFELKSILIVSMITFVIYHLSISFYVDHFPNGRPQLDVYNVSVEMLEDYGDSMDDDEFEDFKNIYNKQVKQADKYLKEDKDAIKAKITNYEEFRNKHGDLNSKILFEKEVDLFWELEAREWFIETYEHKEQTKEGIYQRSNEKQRERVSEILKSDEINSVLPQMVMENYIDYIKNVAFLIMLSIMFMISPIYLRDKRNDLSYLQYSSKTGRNLFKKKIIAGLLSSFIIITVQLALFMLIYSSNRIGIFLNSSTLSIFNWIDIRWFDTTFIQYIVLTILGVYLLGFIITMLVMFISSIVSNYISVIGIQIPLIIINGYIFIKYLILMLMSIHLPKYSGVLSYLFLLVISMLLISIRWRREKIKDIKD